MAGVVYTVKYRHRRKGTTSGFQDLDKEVPLSDEIVKKNHNQTELKRIFISNIYMYHPGDSIEILGFHKNTNYGNYSNVWDISIGGNKDKQEPSKKTKPSKSIWRSPTWMIPFRIVWYLIKKIFSIAGWLMEGKTN